jgi:GntR family transcriptional regulator, transcriptional repressor for pyruvate dehydrogenase complex
MSVPQAGPSGVPKQDLTNQLLARFKDLISQGVIRPGTRLPPERELAKRFKVSRSSLRHVLKVLDIMGVLTQRVGDGTYLTTSAARTLSEPLQFLVLLDGISLFDLLETRLMVEPELAARAAVRATPEDLAAIRAAFEAMRNEGDLREVVELDLAFHHAIFQAAGNVLCDRIFTLIHRSMSTSISLTSQLVDWEHTISFHRPIWEAIERRLPEEARSAMVAHLMDARELLVKVSSRPERVALPAELLPLALPSRRRTARGGG